MKSSLQLNLHQHLTITPQLQQAIKLLQLSSLELQQEIQYQLEINPLLDIAANEEIELEPDNDINPHDTDFQWSQLYTTPQNTHEFNQSDYPYEHLHCTTMTLKDHLFWQLNLTPMTDIDREIAITLIDATDENGFLTMKPNDIYTDLGKSYGPLSFAEFETVRHRLLRFDPIGCVATNLCETLLIQLEQLSATTPHLDLTKTIIQKHIDCLARHDYSKLNRLCHINERTLASVLTLISHLNPRPGGVIQNMASEYIMPDLIIKRTANQWSVELNPAVLPQLGINQQYAALIKNNGPLLTHHKTDYQFLKNNLKNARYFLSNIRKRQETLLSVARFIVHFQSDYFERGEQAMKPLTLNQVAQALNLHESTISRITTQKFIHTPHGLFELNTFFSNPVETKNGNSCSSIAIRARIKQLISKEASKNPLTDTIIAEVLSQQGIIVARRTVTKYRQQMGIMPAKQRQRIQQPNWVIKENHHAN
jgi:RNA polymerase sigma-54 factor